MAAPKYKKNKFITEEEFEEFAEMTEDELVAKLKAQEAYLSDQEKAKKESDLRKELTSEISEYRKNWAKENPDKIDEMERLKEEIDHIKNIRDAKIESDLDEQKAINADYNDKINGAKARIRALAHCLRFHQ